MSIDQVKAKVQRILTETFGSVSVDQDGDFFTRFDSAVVYIRPFEKSDEVTLVRTWSIMLRDVPLTPEVYRWVATEGQAFFFGRAQLFEEEGGKGSIHFSHNLLGDFLDPEELQWAVIALGNSANELDDQLQSRFGGRKFLDS